MPTRILISICIVTSFATQARAWGERGHFIIGYTAARLFETQPTPVKQKKLGIFFTSRTLMLGLLSQIPDIEWKDPRYPQIVKENDPCHYFDTEYVLGLPKNLRSYLTKIRNLQPNLPKFVKEYIGKPSRVNPSKTITFSSLGSAPFRTQQLFQMMVSAFRCASSKRPLTAKQRRWAALHFRNPLRSGYYKCSKNSSRLEDLAAAIEIGGVMSHFIGDLTQPFHVTADYNGWGTGHGGIHAYFESNVLHYLDENLGADVLRDAENPARQRQIMKQLRLTKFSGVPIPTIMFHLIADSYSKRQEFLDADSRSALLKPSTICRVGYRCPPHSHLAVRRDFRNPKVQAAFRPIIVERLTVAAYVVYKIWHLAWVEGGRPDVHNIKSYAMPYPLKVPFIRLSPLLKK